MKVCVAGGTGLVGRFVVEGFLARNADVTVLGRRAPGHDFFSKPVTFSAHQLGTTPTLQAADLLVHAGFAHVPGRYRGGEGDDPRAFRQANLHGSDRLFRAARAAGIRAVIFLSSRAVYDGYPDGTPLPDGTPCHPKSLYGMVKAQAEGALAALSDPDFQTASLRATGVYGPAGPGQPHKWQALFADFLAAHPVPARRATEVHGADLFQAITCLLDAPPAARAGQAYNLSDILLDRHDLLAEVARLRGADIPLPPRADAPVSQMSCERLRALGWAPGGMARLRATLPELLA